MNYHIIATSDVTILRLRNEALEKVMKLIKYSDKDSLLNFFKTVEGFCEVNESKIRSLIDCDKIEPLEINRGNVVTTWKYKNSLGKVEKHPE